MARPVIGHQTEFPEICATVRIFEVNFGLLAVVLWVEVASSGQDETIAEVEHGSGVVTVRQDQRDTSRRCDTSGVCRVEGVEVGLLAE